MKQAVVERTWQQHACSALGSEMFTRIPPLRTDSEEEVQTLRHMARLHGESTMPGSGMSFLPANGGAFSVRFDAQVQPTVPVRTDASETPFEIPVWLENVLERIAVIRNLPENWDSYGASIPNPSSCDLAQRILFDIADLEEIPVPFVSPASNGSIYIKFTTPQRELELALDDPSGAYASCLCVAKLPKEETSEKTIWLEGEFRKMVLWLLSPAT